MWCLMYSQMKLDFEPIRSHSELGDEFPLKTKNNFGKTTAHIISVSHNMCYSISHNQPPKHSVSMLLDFLSICVFIWLIYTNIKCFSFHKNNKYYDLIMISLTFLHRTYLQLQLNLWVESLSRSFLKKMILGMQRHFESIREKLLHMLIVICLNTRRYCAAGVSRQFFVPTKSFI